MLFRHAFIAAALAALPLTATAQVGLGFSLHINSAPPPPRAEYIPNRLAPGEVWVPGHWAWRHGWVWMPGHREYRPGARWITGHWDRRGGEYVWVEGYWANEPVTVIQAPPPAPAPEVVVQEAPPPVVQEVIPAPPGPEYVWVRGHYVWRYGHWAWEGGRYQRRVHGGDWTEGHWDRRPGGYVWIEGHWR